MLATVPVSGKPLADKLIYFPQVKRLRRAIYNIAACLMYE